MKVNSQKCEYCGNDFTSKRNDARFCCNSHRQLSYLDYLSSKSSTPLPQNQPKKDEKQKINNLTLLKLKDEITIEYLKKENEELRCLVENMIKSLEKL